MNPYICDDLFPYFCLDCFPSSVYSLNDGLEMACRYGYLEVASLLVDRWIKKVNEPPHEWLFPTGRGGHRKIAEMLISKGPLDLGIGLEGACAGGQVEMAEWIIQFAQDMGTPLKSYDIERAFQWACDYNFRNTAQLMINHGACEWNIAITSAREKGQMDMVTWLIELGADPDACDPSALGHHHGWNEK